MQQNHPRFRSAEKSGVHRVASEALNAWEGLERDVGTRGHGRARVEIEIQATLRGQSSCRDLGKDVLS